MAENEGKAGGGEDGEKVSSVKSNEKVNGVEDVNKINDGECGSKMNGTESGGKNGEATAATTTASEENFDTILTKLGTGRWTIFYLVTMAYCECKHVYLLTHIPLLLLAQSIFSSLNGVCDNVYKRIFFLVLYGSSFPCVLIIFQGIPWSKRLSLF